MSGEMVFAVAFAAGTEDETGAEPRTVSAEGSLVRLRRWQLRRNDDDDADDADRDGPARGGCCGLGRRRGKGGPVHRGARSAGSEGAACGGSVVEREWSGHGREVNRVKWDGTNRVAYSASLDRTVRRWRDDSDGPGVLAGHAMSVTGLDVSPDGTGLVTGSRDCTVRFWDAATGRERAVRSVDRNVVTEVRWLPGESSPVAVQAGEDLALRVWDERVAAPVHVFATGRPHFALSCAVARDSIHVATGETGCEGDGCSVLLWDRRRTGAPLVELRGHSQAVRAVEFLPGKAMRVASASRDRTLRLWDLEPGAEGDCRAVGLLDGSLSLTGLASSPAPWGEGACHLWVSSEGGQLGAWQVERPDLGSSWRLVAQSAST